jgi:hypothetical protein
LLALRPPPTKKEPHALTVKSKRVEKSTGCCAYGISIAQTPERVNKKSEDKHMPDEEYPGQAEDDQVVAMANEHAVEDEDEICRALEILGVPPIEAIAEGDIPAARALLNSGELMAAPTRKQMFAFWLRVGAFLACILFSYLFTFLQYTPDGLPEEYRIWAFLDMTSLFLAACIIVQWIIFDVLAVACEEATRISLAERINAWLGRRALRKDWRSGKPAQRP